MTCHHIRISKDTGLCRDCDADPITIGYDRYMIGDEVRDNPYDIQPWEREWLEGWYNAHADSR